MLRSKSFAKTHEIDEQPEPSSAVVASMREPLEGLTPKAKLLFVAAPADSHCILDQVVTMVEGKRHHSGSAASNA